MNVFLGAPAVPAKPPVIPQKPPVIPQKPPSIPEKPPKKPQRATSTGNIHRISKVPELPKKSAETPELSPRTDLSAGNRPSPRKKGKSAFKKKLFSTFRSATHDKDKDKGSHEELTKSQPLVNPNYSPPSPKASSESYSNPNSPKLPKAVPPPKASSPQTTSIHEEKDKSPTGLNLSKAPNSPLARPHPTNGGFKPAPNPVRPPPPGGRPPPRNPNPNTNPNNAQSLPNSVSGMKNSLPGVRPPPPGGRPPPRNPNPNPNPNQLQTSTSSVSSVSEPDISKSRARDCKFHQNCNTCDFTNYYFIQ